MKAIPVIFFYLFAKKFKDFYIRKELRLILGKIIVILNENDIYYWIDFGTLLGLYRDNDIIFGDNDIDICIFENSVKNIQKIENKLKENGFFFKKTDRVIKIFKKNTLFPVYADIYINKIINNSVSIWGEHDDRNIPINLVNTNKIIKWKNLLIKTPNNIPKLLELRYGKDFMTPIKGKKAHYKRQGKFGVFLRGIKF
jgi:phosphorylcholine metabolism protein LicD